jgi:exonuclease III
MNLKIGTWNVQTLLRPEKMQKIAEKLNDNKMDITALQEVRLSHRESDGWGTCTEWTELELQER